MSRISIGLVVLTVPGCNRSRPPESPTDLPNVVASIFPIADLAASLGGGDIHVDVLLPAGASPATFELTPGQIRILRAADVYLSVGGGLDSWVGASQNDSTRLVVLTDGLQLVDDDEGDLGNPHVWLDPALVRDHVLPAIALALQAAAPEARDRIALRWDSLADSLSKLEMEITRTLAPLESRAFLASHPAWTYYAQRFNLEELGAVHETPGSEPSPRALAALIDRARAADVSAVFAEPQFGEAAASALAVELGSRVFMLDPLGGPRVPSRDGYLALMRYNTAQLFAGLGSLN